MKGLNIVSSSLHMKIINDLVLFLLPNRYLKITDAHMCDYTNRDYINEPHNWCYKYPHPVHFGPMRVVYK